MQICNAYASEDHPAVAAATPSVPLLPRVPTGVPGLDAVLNGGLLRGGSYIVMGHPGTGKTILANQICFNHVAAGGRALFVTLLAETHARMLAHIQPLAFFTPAPIGDALYYVSGYRELEERGLGGLLELLRGLVREQRPSLLVVDGLITAESVADSDRNFRRFLHELHVYLEAHSCTSLLLTQHPREEQHPEHTMVDGLIELYDHNTNAAAVREIQVHKLRGSSFLRGRHALQISDAGITVYPRIEALLASPPPVAVEDRVRMDFGIERLDEMLLGGLLSASTTLILGAPGAGKTVLGLHFLAAGARRGEPGTYFGFHETPPRLIAKADSVGCSFSDHVRNGLIEVMWQPALEDILDALAERLLNAVRRRRVRRLFIDGIDGFRNSTIYPDRIGRFFTALANELRTLDVTTLCSTEIGNLFGPEVMVPGDGVAATVDNLIFLRYVELRSQLYRLLSILKVRESAYDPAIREFEITDRGINVAATFESAEAILTGVARRPLAEGPGGASSRSGRRTRSNSGGS
jgi:circadian clock protein KaiC